MDATLVSRDPEIMSGALCFTGTRVPVQNLFDYLEGSSSLEDFLEDFPSVQRETAVAVLELARGSNLAPISKSGSDPDYFDVVRVRLGKSPPPV